VHFQQQAEMKSFIYSVQSCRHSCALLQAPTPAGAGPNCPPWWTRCAY